MNLYNSLRRWAAKWWHRKEFFWMAYQKNWMIDPCTDKRAKYWKRCGAHISGKINIGYDVYFDADNAKHIYIEEGVWIASRCLILCHKRDMSDYCVGDDYNKLPYQHRDVVLKKGCTVGMGSIVMPGVTIGEGSIIGAGSVVVKDIPAWSIAIGNPAKVVKQIPQRGTKQDNE